MYENMAEQTVIQKWSQDIEAMNASLNSLRDKFQSYKTKFNADVTALTNSFKAFSQACHADVDAIWKHIWGTEEEKQKWQAKYGG